MSRKNCLVDEILSNQSLSTSFTSPVTVIRYLDNLSYQINIATTNSTGTFNFQGSDDYAINETTGAVSNPGNWVTLPLSSPIVAAGANDTAMVSLNQIPHQAIRCQYVSSVAGTGTASIYITFKMIGG